MTPQERQAKWKAAHPGLAVARAKAWIAENREAHRVHCKTWKQNNRERVFTVEQCRRFRERGIDPASVPPPPADGCCQLCDRKRRLCADHDHKTRRHRGWICWPCNVMLGHIEPNLTLDAVASYLNPGGV